jgi:hypothetical protein
MQTGDHGGPIFTYPFSATALTTGGSIDLWCVTGSSISRTAVREIVFGQYSDAADAQSEMLSVTLMSGSTAPSSGTAITGLNINRYSTAQTPAATCSVVGPSTTLASTTSATVVRAETFNVMGGYRFYPVPAERPIIGLSQRFVVRITVPNDALTVNGTLMLQEIGQTPQ